MAMAVLADHTPTISFEFFPPKTEKGWAGLESKIGLLEQLGPSFVSVTYGAGGSTREHTHELVERILRETTLQPVPHLTCIGHTRDEIERILERYAQAGVRALLALRGDLPNTETGNLSGDFEYAADLVEHIRRFSDRNRLNWSIGVAGFPEGHPDTPNVLVGMDHLKTKIDAGADWLCTQLFFDNRRFHDWRERARLAGIDVPIIAGVMPVTSKAGLYRMADLAAGTVFPAALLRALDRAAPEDKEAIAEIGVHWATEQCRDLLDHEVDGIHFYTLNQSDATIRIHRSLGVRSSAGLRNA